MTYMHSTAVLFAYILLVNCVPIEEIGRVMTGALYWIILAGCLTTAALVGTILFETIAAIAFHRKTFGPLTGSEPRDRIGVLIPAHNEEEMLPETVANIKLQLRDGDWLLVVADNCSDRTATVAKGLGADVIVRSDPTKIGKGFALDCGVRHFAKDPPKILVVIDADCKLGDFAIDHLAAVCNATVRPVQAFYTMQASPNPTPSTRAREFAWRIKNWIRPLGLSSAGLPCQLMGTGMAFPWKIIATANLATGALVEDLKLGLELAGDGHSPVFCSAATVFSEFPVSSEGSRSQQLRWEQGHLGTIATEIPKLFSKALRRRDISLLALILDASVPPLSLLWIIIVAFLGLGLAFWGMGEGSAVILVGLFNLAGFTWAAIICWIMVGRDLLPPWSVFLLGLRVFRKFPFYLRIALRRNGQSWIRTDRRKL
jgi:cellulose synthase/poly-beta-1,6-N-acetylglucosamine synthase-like glycosyltransferase